MCEYASFILMPDLQIGWTESNNHEECIRRLGLLDYDPGPHTTFLRVECQDGDVDHMEFDSMYRIDDDSMPEWYLDNIEGYRRKCKCVLNQLNPIYQEYDALIERLWCTSWLGQEQVKKIEVLLVASYISRIRDIPWYVAEGKEDS